MGVSCAEDLFSIYEVNDLSIFDLNLRRDPLIAVKSSLHIWWCTKLAIAATGEFNICARDAQLSRWPLVFTISSMKVLFHANRKLLF